MYLEAAADGSTNRLDRFTYDNYLCIARNRWQPDGTFAADRFIWDPTEPVATRPLIFYQPNAPPQLYSIDGNKNISELVSSDSGTISAHYEYAPFGEVILSPGDLAFTNPFRFSSEYADDLTALVYYNFRHYHPVDGLWLNRDPIEEEGGENLYAFCANSPVWCYDVNGCWALIDNAIAAIGGALVGVACQAISDVIRGEASGWESYVGSAVAGAIMGEVLLHNPAMAGATKAMYSGMAAAVGNGVRQFCEVAVSKKTENFNTQEMVVDLAAGAAFSMIPFPGIDGINKGQGSYLSIARSMNKKFVNGSISRVSTSTTVKSFVGTSVEYGSAYGAAQPFVTDMVNQGINTLPDMMTPANTGMQMSYSEVLIITVTDKCGNVVVLYYTREGNSNE